MYIFRCVSESLFLGSSVFGALMFLTPKFSFRNNALIHNSDAIRMNDVVHVIVTALGAVVCGVCKRDHHH